MYDVLKCSKLLYAFPFGKTFNNIIRVLEGYNKVSIFDFNVFANQK